MTESRALPNCFRHHPSCRNDPCHETGPTRRLSLSCRGVGLLLHARASYGRRFWLGGGRLAQMFYRQHHALSRRQGNRPSPGFLRRMARLRDGGSNDRCWPTDWPLLRHTTDRYGNGGHSRRQHPAVFHADRPVLGPGEDIRAVASRYCFRYPRHRYPGGASLPFRSLKHSCSAAFRACSAASAPPSAAIMRAAT